MVKQYPKLLAFLHVFYPELYSELSRYSNKSDLVESRLICSNNHNNFQAIIYSEDVSKDGELLEVYTGKNSLAPYSWDWRWVFAVKLLFAGNIIFPIKFKQKVIALPTGKHPLTDVFFNILQEEFTTVLKGILRKSQDDKLSIHDCFYNYTDSVNLKIS